MSLPLANKPTVIEWGAQRFLILDCPKEHNLHLYLKTLKEEGVTDLVRVCSKSYPAEEVEAAGIRLHEMEYDDGDAPPKEILDAWLGLVDETFKRVRPGDQHKPTIATHCVAGLGRAPVLVAIAIIESGADPLMVVNYIRQRRRGAINVKQLQYLESYSARTRSKRCTIC